MTNEYCVCVCVCLLCINNTQDLQVKVSFPHPTDPTHAELECRSRCGLADDPPYIWFRNGQNVGQGVNYSPSIQSGDSFSCAVEGYELRSPLVCKSIPR